MFPYPPQKSPATFVDLIANTNAFPTPFPTLQNRLSSIASRSESPESTEARILADAPDTRILVHRKVLNLAKDFLKVKVDFGSSIERNLYEEMGEMEFIQRLILKRPLSFMGEKDETVGRDGRYVASAFAKWPLGGTELEQSPLRLQGYLSYDEIALSGYPHLLHQFRIETQQGKDRQGGGTHAKRSICQSCWTSIRD